MLKLFGKKKQREKIKESVNATNVLFETDLDDIWIIAERNSFIIAMSGWVSKKCNYGNDIGKLSHAERVFYLVNELEMEINNSGFEQYLYNSSGNFANEIVNALREIKACATSEIIGKALTAIGCTIPEERSEREEKLDEMLTDDVSEIFSECDNEFYEYTDNLEELNYQFILNNKDQFCR